jgi:20S proteasome alpha/beta subunit
MTLDSHKLLVGAGTPADCVNFNEYIQRNLTLYELNNDIKLKTHGAAHFIRGEVKRVRVLREVNVLMMRSLCPSWPRH